MLGINGELTSCNVLKNNVDVAAANLLVEAVKDKGISLCGIKPDQKEGNFRNRALEPPDAILLASDLSKAGVTGQLTKCELRGNKLGVEGWTSIFNALRDSPSSKITEWNLYNEKLGPEIAKPLAEYISITGQLTKLGCACPKSNLGCNCHSALTALCTG